MRYSKKLFRSQLNDWTTKLAETIPGQWEYSQEKYAERYATPIEAVLNTLSERQLKAVLALVSNSNSMGWAQQRAHTRTLRESAPRSNAPLKLVN